MEENGRTVVSDLNVVDFLLKNRQYLVLLSVYP